MDNKKNKTSQFIKKYPLIFKKYSVSKKITTGAFSEIYSGINIINKEKVAIKIEKRNLMNKYLESECYTLFSLNNIGIPKVLSFGHNKEYNILVMPLLGKSLLDIFISNNSNYEFKDICLIGIQVIERIQWVHSRSIIHRDIKPDNFLIGLNDPYLIYLIDFGLSKKYKSTKTGKHIQISELKKFTGSIMFASANSLKLLEQSRRDDLESIGYMIIYLMQGNLPWQKIRVVNKKESYLKVARIKRYFTPEKLCKDLPKEITEYMRYVKNLKFEEEPNYAYLRNLFVQMMEKQGFEGGTYFFSWVNLNNMNISTIQRQINLSKKSSSRKRIIIKMRKTLENHSEKKINNILTESYNYNKDNLVENYNKFNINKKVRNFEEKKIINQKKINNIPELNTFGRVITAEGNPGLIYKKIDNNKKAIINTDSNNDIIKINNNYLVSSTLTYNQEENQENNNIIYTENNINKVNNYKYNNMNNLVNLQQNKYNANNFIKINPYNNRATQVINNNNHKRISSINFDRHKEIFLNKGTINNISNSLKNNKKKKMIIINNNIFPYNSLYYNNTISNNKPNFITQQNNLNTINNIKAQNNRLIHNRYLRKFKLMNIFNKKITNKNITFQKNNNENIIRDNEDLIKEINDFNKRYNNEQIMNYGNKLKQIKINKRSQLIKSSDYTKNNIKKKEHTKFKSPTNKNCSIF